MGGPIECISVDHPAQRGGATYEAAIASSRLNKAEGLLLDWGGLTSYNLCMGLLCSWKPQR